MVYIHWIVVIIIGGVFFKATHDKSVKVLLSGIFGMAFFSTIIIAWSLFLDRGSIFEIFSMQVAHRSSAYLVFTYGVALGAFLRLLAKMRSTEKDKKYL